jgi:hypothetical protein
MPSWFAYVLPELARFAPGERRRALEAARRTELDVLELAGVAALLVLVAWVTGGRPPVDAGIAARMLGALLDFATALTLVGAGFLPLHLRRLRRGLRAQLHAGGRA